MSTIIIITFCALLLIAYVFDLTSSKTNIPSVILLLLLGWGIRQIIDISRIKLPDFSPMLPVLGTLGLILIVLEGALELSYSRSKIRLINKSFLGAFVPMLVMAFLVALLFMFFGGYSLKAGLINAIPFCIISSAIAIPSVKNLTRWKKEFIIYESSFSDILGVLFFTFITMNEVISIRSFGVFGLQIIIMLVISLIATFGLSYLLSKIQHHIKFIPIILLVILIYSISLIFNLPALIFILLFGLFLGNLNKIQLFKHIKKFHIEALKNEVVRFKELTIEATFLVRTIFFLLFGYLMETSTILNPSTIPWSLGIVIIIFSLRALQLKLSGFSLKPLVFIAQGGLSPYCCFFPLHRHKKFYW